MKEIISNSKFEETWKLVEPEKSYVKLRLSFPESQPYFSPNILVTEVGKSENSHNYKGTFNNVKNQLQMKSNLTISTRKDNYFTSFSSFSSKDEITTPKSIHLNTTNVDNDCMGSTSISSTNSEEGKIKQYLKLFEKKKSPTKDPISIKKQSNNILNTESSDTLSPLLLKHTSSDTYNKFERKTVTNQTEIIRKVPSRNLFIPNPQDNLKILGYDELLFKEDDDTNESFAQAFFGVSILENPKTIPGSERIGAPCQHRSCGSFNAYKPEIVFKIPKNNKKFELNSTVKIV